MEMEPSSKRRHLPESETLMAESVDGEDRLSELPVHIIHHILCDTDLSSHDGAITSVLSKKWYYYWLSRPCLVFRQFDGDLKDFVQVVDRPLQIHVEHNLNLAKFFMSYWDRELDPYLDRWIESAVKVDVEFLVIHAPDIDSSYYSLPDAFYNAKKLDALWLSNCKFEFDISTTCIRFYCLREVCLHNALISDAQMQSVLDKCPSIRSITLMSCKGMSKLYVVGRLHLDFLNVSSCKLDSVIVQAPKLGRFKYTEEYTDQGNVHPCEIAILEVNNTLHTLELNGASITDQQFRDIYDKIPNVSGLYLTSCNKLKCIEIQSEKLKKVDIFKFESIEKITIQAPNLLQFNFEGEKMPILSLGPSLESVRLNFFLPSTVISNFGDVDSSWYTNLNHFVQNFNYSKGLMLIVYCQETNNILFYENTREILIPPSHNVGIFIVPIRIIELLLVAILFNRPSIISILPCTDSKALKALPAVERCIQNQNCGNECPLSTTFLHKHRVLEEIISCTGTSEEEMTSIWYTWLKSTPLIGKVNSFMFKWKRQA